MFVSVAALVYLCDKIIKRVYEGHFYLLESGYMRKEQKLVNSPHLCGSGSLCVHVIDYGCACACFVKSSLHYVHL